MVSSACLSVLGTHAEQSSAECLLVPRDNNHPTEREIIMNISDRRRSSELAEILSFLIEEYVMEYVEYPIINFTSQELRALSGPVILTSKYISDVNFSLIDDNLVLLSIGFEN